MPIIGEPVRSARSITLQIFSAIRFAERSAEHREILREEKDLASVDRRASGHDAVAEKLFLVQSERVGAMDDERVEFGERALDRPAHRCARGPCVCRAGAASRSLPRRPALAPARVFGRAHGIVPRASSPWPHYSMAIACPAGAAAAAPLGGRSKSTSGESTSVTTPKKKKASAKDMVAACCETIPRRRSAAHALAAHVAPPGSRD